MRRRIMLAGLILCAADASPQQSITLADSRVTAAIHAAFPGATVVAPADINSSDCGSSSASPGFVAGDFDGGGRTDFAVLLKLGETGKVVTWGGKRLNETRYVFAIFLATPDEAYVATHVRPFVDLWPLSALISLRRAGTLEGPGDPGHAPTMRLRHAGVEFFNCGKSSLVYYLSNNRVREFWTSD